MHFRNEEKTFKATIWGRISCYRPPFVALIEIFVGSSVKRILLENSKISTGTPCGGLKGVYIRVALMHIDPKSPNRRVA